MTTKEMSSLSINRFIWLANFSDKKKFIKTTNSYFCWCLGLYQRPSSEVEAGTSSSGSRHDKRETESQIVLPGWSRRPYASARKVHNPCTVMKASTNSVTHMIAFLARQVQVQILVVTRTGRSSTSFFFWWRSLMENEMSTKVRIGCFDKFLIWSWARCLTAEWYRHWITCH